MQYYTDTENFIDIDVPGDYTVAQHQPLTALPPSGDTENIATGERA